MKYSWKYNLILLSAPVLNSKDSTKWPCGVERRKCNKRWKFTISKIFHTVFYSFNLRMCFCIDWTMLQFTVIVNIIGYLCTNVFVCQARILFRWFGAQIPHLIYVSYILSGRKRIDS